MIRKGNYEGKSNTKRKFTMTLSRDIRSRIDAYSKKYDLVYPKPNTDAAIVDSAQNLQSTINNPTTCTQITIINTQHDVNDEYRNSPGNDQNIQSISPTAGDAVTNAEKMLTMSDDEVMSVGEVPQHRSLGPRDEVGRRVMDDEGEYKRWTLASHSPVMRWDELLQR